MNKIILCLLLLIIFVSRNATGQVVTVTFSAKVINKSNKETIPYANVILKRAIDSTFITGTITDLEGRFTIEKVKPGNYLLAVSFIGIQKNTSPFYIGNLSAFLDLPAIALEESMQTLREVRITSKTEEISEKLDKKTYSLAENLSQTGGSVLQSMQNLPGVTVTDGKVQLRGNEKITVLIDGKQTALTGFGSQTGLDNLPASAIDKIEIINNPSASYDANGNAGIINIILKKNKQEGFNGKVGIATGLGSLWVRKDNLPSIRPQYTNTPKINPSIALNYKKGKTNI